MKAIHLLAAAATLALSASAVAAQDTSMQPSGQYVAPPPSAGSAAINTSAVATDPSLLPATSSQVTTQADGATLINNVVTNGPVPDTRANRARYGRPLSNAGKRTAPVGN